MKLSPSRLRVLASGLQTLDHAISRAITYHNIMIKKLGKKEHWLERWNNGHVEHIDTLLQVVEVRVGDGFDGDLIKIPYAALMDASYKDEIPKLVTAKIEKCKADRQAMIESELKHKRMLFEKLKAELGEK
jgi:hypothetical protein